MIEANRVAYRDKAKVIPIIAKATEKPAEAVDYALDVLAKNCVWSVNAGFDPARTQWTIDNSVENGDVPKDDKPTVEQVANLALAKEAVDAAGGPIDDRQSASCKDTRLRQHVVPAKARTHTPHELGSTAFMGPRAFARS